MRGQGLRFCGEVEDIAGCETSALLKDPSTGLPPLLEFGEISRGDINYTHLGNTTYCTGPRIDADTGTCAKSDRGDFVGLIQ